MLLAWVNSLKYHQFTSSFWLQCAFTVSEFFVVFSGVSTLENVFNESGQFDTCGRSLYTHIVQVLPSSLFWPETLVRKFKQTFGCAQVTKQEKRTRKTHKLLVIHENRYYLYMFIKIVDSLHIYAFSTMKNRQCYKYNYNLHCS